CCGCLAIVHGRVPHPAPQSSRHLSCPLLAAQSTITPTRSRPVPRSLSVTVTGSEKAIPPSASFATFRLNLTTRVTPEDALEIGRVAAVWTVVSGVVCFPRTLRPEGAGTQAAAGPPMAGLA